MKDKSGFYLPKLHLQKCELIYNSNIRFHLSYFALRPIQKRLDLKNQSLSTSRILDMTCNKYYFSNTFYKPQKQNFSQVVNKSK